MAGSLEEKNNNKSCSVDYCYFGYRLIPSTIASAKINMQVKILFLGIQNAF